MSLSDWMTLAIAFCSVIAVPMILWGGSNINTLKTQVAVADERMTAHEDSDDIRFAQIKQTLDRLELGQDASNAKLDRLIERRL